MDRSDYAILTIIDVTTLAIGVVTTMKPLGTLVVESIQQAATTTVTMAWITWWVLVIGFAITGDIEA